MHRASCCPLGAPPASAPSAAQCSHRACHWLSLLPSTASIAGNVGRPGQNRRRPGSVVGVEGRRAGPARVIGKLLGQPPAMHVMYTGVQIFIRWSWPPAMSALTGNRCPSVKPGAAVPGRPPGINRHEGHRGPVVGRKSMHGDSDASPSGCTRKRHSDNRGCLPGFKGMLRHVQPEGGAERSRPAPQCTSRGQHDGCGHGFGKRTRRPQESRAHTG